MEILLYFKIRNKNNCSYFSSSYLYTVPVGTAVKILAVPTLKSAGPGTSGRLIFEPCSNIQQAGFHKHFCQLDHHGLSDWSIKLIDQANDEISLRRQERFWQYKLKTFSPDGLNEKEVPLVVR